MILDTRTQQERLLQEKASVFGLEWYTGEPWQKRIVSRMTWPAERHRETEPIAEQEQKSE